MEDRLEVIKMMAQGGVFDEDETIILELLVEKQNRHVEAVFRRYEQAKDVLEMTKNLKLIAKTAGDFLVASVQDGEEGEDEEEEEEEEEYEEEGMGEEEEEEEEQEEGEDDRYAPF
jgi:hypothetical protein